ncbi:MAG: UMP kinase [Patescibacteria group bacterium]
MKNRFCIIALGGSLIVPHLSDDGGVNVPFLREFRKFLLQELKDGKRFMVVAGGGKTTRVYQKGASEVVRVSKEDLDWLGLHPTRLNAHLLRTIFAREAYPRVLDHDPSLREVSSLRAKRKRLLIGGGWRPGWSTDYVAIRLAQKFKVREVIIAGDTPFVYDKDPRKHKDAEPLEELSWKEYRRLIPRKWSPGFSSPVDPVGAKLAQEQGITAKILHGADLANLRRAIRNKPFTGSVISG